MAKNPKGHTLSDTLAKRPAGTIDLTPTWSGILPVLIALIRDGNEAGQASAMLELNRMAQLADRYVLLSEEASGGFNKPFAND